MANPFGTSGGFGFGSKTKLGSLSAPPKKEGTLARIGHGAVHASEHLVSDVKDAVVGLPTGLVLAAEHPIGAAKSMANAEWQTWSPLFHGDLGKFAHGVYDHPLAPLLDIGTVFSLGAAAAVRGAQLVDESSRLAQFGKIGEHTLTDPTGLGRHPVTQQLSSNPGRRILQETKLKYLEPHLPQWYKQSRYEHSFRVETQHRQAAYQQNLAHNLQYVSVLKTGEALTEPATRLPAQYAIASNMWQSLEAHAPHALQPGEKLPKGYKYLLPHGKAVSKIAETDTPDAFEKRLRGYKLRSTTSSEARAFKRADGTLPIVSTRAVQRYGAEAARSHVMVRWLWHNPSRIWKMAVVGWTPRVVTNNGVGNWLIYAMRQGGHHSVAGIYDAIRLTKGQRALRRLSQPGLIGAKSSDWAIRHHLDELHDTFGASLNLAEGAKTKLGRRLQQGFYPAVHATSDKPVRLAALAAFYRGAPEVRQLMKNGHSFDQAVDAAIAQNPALRRAASSHVRTIAGDYTAMGGMEQKIRDIVPFYLWDKHIVKTTANMLLDQPGRVVLAQRLSNQGEQATERLIGQVPEFLKGALPLSLLGIHDAGARKRALMTYSLNPFATIGDLASAVQGATTGGGIRSGQALLEQMNPMIGSAIEDVQGTSLLTGQKIKTRGGILPHAYISTFVNIPELRLGGELLHPSGGKTAKGNDRLYAHTRQEAGTAFLGIPIKGISPDAAAGMAQLEKEPPSPFPRKRKKQNPFG